MTIEQITAERNRLRAALEKLFEYVNEHSDAIVGLGLAHIDEHNAMLDRAEQALVNTSPAPVSECWERRGTAIYGEDRGPGTAPLIADLHCDTVESAAEKAQKIVDAHNSAPAPTESANKELLDALKTIEGTGHSDDGGQWASNIASAAIAKAEKAGG